MNSTGVNSKISTLRLNIKTVEHQRQRENIESNEKQLITDIQGTLKSQQLISHQKLWMSEDSEITYLKY